ncbi:hypothetical protein [Chitinolyticbacter albus]|uniref:hypothetical protein n=1 Tax=Chitinolyticbacter albus TaxID=2961951 RepID=UPI00210B5FA1|nr:hypothetical protein [Chitinolyticbacter albus]
MGSWLGLEWIVSVSAGATIASQQRDAMPALNAAGIQAQRSQLDTRKWKTRVAGAITRGATRLGT